jgi:glutamate 5-kinase
MKNQNFHDKDLERRRGYLERARRVVVKVGSAVLTADDGLNIAVMERLATDIAELMKSGRQVIMVSSGAVAAGRRKMAIRQKSIPLQEKQALAAIGQSTLMRAYEDIYSRLGVKVAQVLLTHDDLSHRDRYLNVRNTLFTLLHWHILPIINENDTVSVEELRFGDNDTLAALVTNLTEADLLACLTDVPCLYTANPLTDSDAEPVYTVDSVDREVEGMAGNVNSALGTGGMQSKITAAKMVSVRGGCSFIGPGREEKILTSLFAGERVGTFFFPKVHKLHSRKHWIAYTLRPKGSLVLDSGACRAILDKGRSLLPSGILEIQGRFGMGSAVHCLDEKGVAIAAGLVNFSSAELEKIKGIQTSEIQDVLGYKDYDEVIHRDNLVIL